MNWALSFLVLALIAAAFCFGGVAAASAISMAQILCTLFVVLCAVSFVVHVAGGKSTHH